MTIRRIQTGPRLSKATVFAGLVHTAGIVVETPSPSIAAETATILDTIDALLAEAGSGRDRLLWASLWVTDMAHYAEMNAVWDAWLPAGCAPARACVAAGLARTHARVEIAVVAATR